jgi:hypothetical protein
MVWDGELNLEVQRSSGLAGDERRGPSAFLGGNHCAPPLFRAADWQMGWGVQRYVEPPSATRLLSGFGQRPTARLVQRDFNIQCSRSSHCDGRESSLYENWGRPQTPSCDSFVSLGGQSVCDMHCWWSEFDAISTPQPLVSSCSVVCVGPCRARHLTSTEQQHRDNSISSIVCSGRPQQEPIDSRPRTFALCLRAEGSGGALLRLAASCSRTPLIAPNGILGWISSGLVQQRSQS